MKEQHWCALDKDCSVVIGVESKSATEQQVGGLNYFLLTSIIFFMNAQFKRRKVTVLKITFSGILQTMLIYKENSQVIIFLFWPHYHPHQTRIQVN